MWYRDINSGNFQETSNSYEIQVQSFLQEVQVWYGEQPFDANNGVDWLAVLQGQADPRVQMNQIAERYINFFIVQDYKFELDNKSRIIYISFSIVNLADNTTARIENLQIGA